MRKLELAAGLAGLAGLLAAALPAQAASVTLCGPNVCYEYDDAQSGATSFGTPTLSGDALVFLVPNFRAESLDGEGLVQVPTVS